MSDSPQISITPMSALVDTPLKIQLSGFDPQQTVMLRSQMTDSAGIIWQAQANYQTDADGQIDLDAHAPISGTYTTADAMGLIWSMTPTTEADRYAMFTRPPDLAPLIVQFEALIEDEVVAQAQVERLHIADGVKRVVVRENGLFGTLFLPAGEAPFPAITLVSGSGGGVYEYRAALFAAHGYAAFTLAYFNYETLPKILVDIPLEYFQTAIDYLQNRDDIDGERLAITGGSRGGELSLLLGSVFPQYKAVMADVPSGVVWGGFGQDPSEGNKPAWVYKGATIPYMDSDYDPEIYGYYADYSERGEAIPGTPGFLETMRRNGTLMKSAEIQVEKINGAVLLISGEDDQMWPSTQLANVAIERFKASEFQHPYEHVSYPGAGHLITPPYSPTTPVTMKHPVDGGFYAFGGEPEAINHANVDSWGKKLKFLAEHL
ncbi:MAG: acyl-CoA thioester hydrolase/BAAT C-terminal domain-containing protein [Aggregatilineales bacterium]